MTEFNHENLLYLTTRIQCITQTKECSVGTGFFFSEQDCVFLVTNQHVLKGMESGSFNLLLKIGATVIPTPKPIDFTRVSFHKNMDIDVAVLDITDVFNSESHVNKYIQKSSFLTSEVIEKYVRPQEQITFIGYPNGIFDYVNNLPLIRNGYTATPCYLDYNGEKKFLIDASVFPGSSGSPVFIYRCSNLVDKKGQLYSGIYVYFLGLISETFIRSEQGRIEMIDIPVSSVPAPIINQMIDIGVVVKAETILKCIEENLKIKKYLKGSLIS